MSNLSKAGVGMYAFMVVSLVKIIWGVELDYNLVLDGILTLLQAGSFILWIVGQITRKDLDFGIFRKK